MGHKDDRTCGCSFLLVSETNETGCQAVSMVFDTVVRGWRQETVDVRVVAESQDPSLGNLVRQQVLGPQRRAFCPRLFPIPFQAVYKNNASTALAKGSPWKV